MSVTNFPLDFRLLFKSAPGAFLILTPDLRIIEATDEFLRMVMRRREEIIGRALFEAFPDNPHFRRTDSAIVRASLMKVLATGEPDELPVQKYDVQRPAEDGGGFEERFWRLIAFPGTDENGKITFLYQRVENITEQIRAESESKAQESINAELTARAEKSEAEQRETSMALEAARFRLEAALTAGEIGTWTWDVARDLVVADENLAKFFSVSEKDAQGGKIEKYLAAIHSDDTEKVGKIISDALTNGDTYEAEYRLINPDDSVRRVIARGRVLRDESGAAAQLPGVVIDITKQKKAEDELRESRKSLALALEAGRAGTFVWNIQTNTNFWSPELETMYGVPVGSFEGDYGAWAKRVVPEDYEKTNHQVKEALERGDKLLDYEFGVIKPNGEQKCFFGRARFEYDADRQPLRMLGINVDITESKRSQDLLLERTRLASLSGDIGIALNRHEDLPNLLKHCTQAFTKNLDAMLVRIWTLDESGAMLELQASSGSRDYADGEYEQIPVGKFMVGRVAERREPYLTNEVSSNSDVGNRKWAQHEDANAFAGYPLIVADRLVGVIAIFSERALSETVLEAMDAYANTIANTIERKRIEDSLSRTSERFQLISRATNDTIWDWNLQTNEVWWNDSVQTMFGYTPDQIAPTADWWIQHIHPEDRERVVEGIHEVIDHGGENWSDEYRFQCADGNYKYVFDRGFAIHRDGKPARMLGAMLDMTDRKHIETEREFLLVSEKSARAEAERANRMKDEFLATLSHELRTPLSSILGWSRMLKEGQIEGEQAQRAVETIERNAKSQAQLIEDVLDVSRIISGKMRLEVRPIDLSSVIETAIDAVRPAAEAKNIRLQRVTDTNVMISGDADRLQQVIWNLLSNAIKFTPKDGRVQIKMERVNSHVEVIVSDNGMGIELETLPFVFDRFRQSDSTTTRKHGGLGLGLAIVRHLVELHGGTVHAASEGLNEGATFTLTFPLIALRAKEVFPTPNDQEIAREHPTASGDVPFFCPQELKNLRVLVVDDEPDTREMLLFILEACQARATGAASVDEALKAVAAETFDVLVSDIGMPERDGFDLIKTIRQLAPEAGGRIPAIALTAYARVEDRLKALHSGFQMHVPKPVDPAELIAVVASLANRGKH